METTVIYYARCVDPSYPPRHGSLDFATRDRQDAIDWLALNAERGCVKFSLKTTTTTYETFEPQEFLTS